MYKLSNKLFIYYYRYFCLILPKSITHILGGEFKLTIFQGNFEAVLGLTYTALLSTANDFDNVLHLASYKCPRVF